jgi:hypothetical protein
LAGADTPAARSPAQRGLPQGGQSQCKGRMRLHGSSAQDIPTWVSSLPSVPDNHGLGTPVHRATVVWKHMHTLGPWQAAYSLHLAMTTTRPARGSKSASVHVIIGAGRVSLTSVSYVRREGRSCQAENVTNCAWCLWCLSNANGPTPGTALSPCITGTYTPAAAGWDDKVGRGQIVGLTWRGGRLLSLRWANPSRSICSTIGSSRAPLGYGGASVALRPACGV